MNKNQRSLLNGMIFVLLLTVAHAQSDDLLVVGTGGNIMDISPAGKITPLVQNLNQPRGTAVDAQGNVFVSVLDPPDSNNTPSSTIYKVDKTGKSTAFAKIPSPPGWLIFDAKGELFFINLQSTLYQISPLGAVTAIQVQTPPTAPRTTTFSGLAFDPQGSLLASNGRNDIYKINPATGEATIFAGGFSDPFGLAFDAAGVLYVANNGNNTVLRISGTGVPTLFAHVSKPAGLAFDVQGNLFITSTSSDTLYQADKSGAVTILVRGAGMDVRNSLVLSRPLFHVAPVPASATDTQPARLTMLVFSAPAVILFIVVLLWFMFRKKEAHE